MFFVVVVAPPNNGMPYAVGDFWSSESAEAYILNTLHATPIPGLTDRVHPLGTKVWKLDEGVPPVRVYLMQMCRPGDNQ